MAMSKFPFIENSYFLGISNVAVGWLIRSVGGSAVYTFLSKTFKFFLGKTRSHDTAGPRTLEKMFHASLLYGVLSLDLKGREHR